MRPAEAHGHAEALRRADGDVGALAAVELAGRFQERQCEQVRRDDKQCAGVVDLLRQRVVVLDLAPGIGVLHKDAADLIGDLELLAARDAQLDTHRLAARLQHCDRLRVHILGADKDRPLAACNPVAHRHGLGRGGAFVQQGRAGQRQARQVADHRLEVQERLEPALRDLRLVRRVGRVPARVLQHLAQDHRRDDRAVVAHPDEAFVDLVLAAHLLESREHVVLALRGAELQGLLHADRAGHGRVDQRVDRVEAAGLGHLGAFIGAWADVPVQEDVGGVEDRARAGGCELAVGLVKSDFGWRHDRAWAGREAGRTRS